MPTVVILVPPSVLKHIFNVGPKVVLDSFRLRNLIGTDTVEQLIFLAEREPISIDPCAVDAPKGGM
jgi:hypothetical protein